MKGRLAMLLALLFGLVLGGCSKEDPQGFAKVDYNKDNRIIFEELIVVFPDLTVEEFLAADADHNGVLDEKEYERFHQARLSGKKLDAASAPPSPAAPVPPAAPAPAPAPVQEPAKAPEPAAPSTAPAPAAIPAAPEATPATGQAGPEAVETVEVGPTATAAAPAAAEGPRTYVVAKGDTLSRIAKKFGVTTKEIMDANKMQAADRLEAGATLTIPASGGGTAQAAVAPPAVTAFVAGVFAKNASGDLNGLLDSYGETVDYYKKGKSGKDIVRQDKADYFSRWPKRSYTPGPAAVEHLPGGDLRVTVPTSFSVSKGEKAVQGQATFTFVLHPAGDTYRIVGEQSVVTKK